MRAAVTAAISVALGSVAFFFYFGMTQLLRRGGAVLGESGSFGWRTSMPGTQLPAESVELPAVIPSTGPSFDPGAVLAYPDHFVARVAPDFVRSTYESFSRYLGQGYQALSLSFDLEHSLTWGFGNSMFFARNADRVLGTDFFVSQSLPGVLERETGWSMFHLWHSIYPWIASDVGLLGTIAVMGVLGFLLAKAWARTLATLDPLWGTLLFLLLLAFFYVPANNQLMQSGETAFGFVVILALIAARAILTGARRRFGPLGSSG